MNPLKKRDGNWQGKPGLASTKWTQMPNLSEMDMEIDWPLNTSPPSVSLNHESMAMFFSLTPHRA